jgi:hypothetical protein
MPRHDPSWQRTAGWDGRQRLRRRKGAVGRRCAKLEGRTGCHPEENHLPRRSRRPRDRASMKHTLIRLLLFATPCLPVAGHAGDVSDPNMNSTMPRCGPQMDGQVYCKFGIIYECQLIGPNSLERRTGWRWKTDLLRACSVPSPAKTNQQNGSSPEVIYAPEQTDHPDAQGSRGDAGTPPGAGGSPQVGTMHIRPGGPLAPSR